MYMTSRPYDACIFDLDGTLANTLASIAHFGNATLEEFGLPPIPTERYKQLVGNGADVLMERMLQTVGAQLPPERRREFRRTYDRRYEGEPMKLVAPYPGRTGNPEKAQGGGAAGGGPLQQTGQHG